VDDLFQCHLCQPRFHCLLRGSEVLFQRTFYFGSDRAFGVRARMNREKLRVGLNRPVYVEQGNAVRSAGERGPGNPLLCNNEPGPPQHPGNVADYYRIDADAASHPFRSVVSLLIRPQKCEDMNGNGKSVCYTQFCLTPNL